MVVFNTFTTPVDGIVHQQKDTRAYVNDKEIGCGTLYITETLMSWCEDEKHIGFSLQYPHISLHAVRRDPFPALYVMVDHYLTLPEGLLPLGMAQPGEEADAGDDSDEGNEECEDQAITELMFSPGQVEMLERMYTAMNQCQALHPDPQDDDDESDVYEDASDLLDDDNFEPLGAPMDVAEERMQDLNLAENGQSNGYNMEGDPEQFADNDEDYKF